MDTAGKLILVLLALTTVISVYILAVDNILWMDNPINFHAYGLVVFVVVNLILIALNLSKPKTGATLVLVWGIVQVLALIGDVATGLGLGFTAQESVAYLFLGQGNPSGLAVDALLVLYLVLAIVGMWARRASTKPQQQSQT